MTEARQDDLTEPISQAKPSRRAKMTVVPSLSDYPRSHAANYIRPALITSEEDFLESVKVSELLMKVEATLKPDQHDRRLPHKQPNARHLSRKTIVLDLADFEIYRCPLTDRKRPSELTSFHLFDVKAKNLCFDGYVRSGNNRYYLEQVRIDDLSIEGYGCASNPGIVAYVQTGRAREDISTDVWLRLQEPASCYERFHSPFMWVAVLGKHVIDYMDEQHEPVGLEQFTKDFHTWLTRRFGSNSQFKQWFAAFGNVQDFRVAFVAYAGFFYNQALNLSTSRHLISHPVWSHCMCDRKTAVERQPNRVRETLASPRVYRSFQQMYFASKLKEMSSCVTVSEMQRKRKVSLGFASDSTEAFPYSRRDNDNSSTSAVRMGDVISIRPDATDKSMWKDSDNEWLAYVQGIEPTRNERKRLMVIWLYRPADTNVFRATYPIANELFLSDNCNCEEREILTTDINRKHSVEWRPPSLNIAKEFFIRQTYITQDSAFVTVKEDHKTCSCRKPKSDTECWRTGDSVYVTKTIDSRQSLEPVAIDEVDYAKKEVTVRILLRLARDCLALARKAGRSAIAPNELVLTGRKKTMPLSRIKRACHVRFIQQSDVLKDCIPSPYNLGGAGDYWFISMGLAARNGCEHLVSLERLPEGFHEAQTLLIGRKLRGLSLFSGGGGLDRGLEQGGAVEFQTSVDYDSAAIHTQRANCWDPKRMRLFCGSVDDYLMSLLSGDTNRLVARVGDVDVIAAGSPCPGFSALQQHMLSDQSLTYASHVTTFCTAADIYRPLYGVLENVVNMASTRTGLEEQNVLSQLVACLVSMGYQVNQYIMDAWTYGSFQRRSRIILTIAAPGLDPILQHDHTHSRPFNETAARSLGKLPNGQRFGDREYYATPFPHVTAEQGTSDLPDIGNGNVQACIQFPNHRLSRPINSKNRALLECIPRHPPGCGYTEAMELNLVPPLLRLTKKETKGACRRIKANGLVPTITTDVSMQDIRSGASVHWSQPRHLALQEARRAQGYPDHEPIIGTLGEQWRILGNGVDRKVSFPIGLSLFKAFTNSEHTHEFGPVLENEAEHMVDVEEETESHFSDASESLVLDTLKNDCRNSPTLSSTDSFSSTLPARRKFETSVPFEGTYDDQIPQGTHSSAPQQVKEKQQPISNEAYFSPLSQNISSNIGIPLRPLPTPLASTWPSLPTKRPREDEGGERQEDTTSEEQRVGPVKRARCVEVRLTQQTH